MDFSVVSQFFDVSDFKSRPRLVVPLFAFFGMKDTGGQ